MHIAFTKAQGTPWKKAWDNCKSQGRESRECTEALFSGQNMAVTIINSQAAMAVCTRSAYESHGQVSKHLVKKITTTKTKTKKQKPTRVGRDKRE